MSVKIEKGIPLGGIKANVKILFDDFCSSMKPDNPISGNWKKLEKLLKAVKLSNLSWKKFEDVNVHYSKIKLTVENYYSETKKKREINHKNKEKKKSKKFKKTKPGFHQIINLPKIDNSPNDKLSVPRFDHIIEKKRVYATS